MRLPMLGTDWLEDVRAPDVHEFEFEFFHLSSRQHNSTILPHFSPYAPSDRLFVKYLFYYVCP